MYHIFICDDEKRFTEVLEKRVETCLKEQGQSYEIQLFYNGIEMFQAMQKKAPEDSAHAREQVSALSARKSQALTWLENQWIKPDPINTPTHIENSISDSENTQV